MEEIVETTAGAKENENIADQESVSDESVDMDEDNKGIIVFFCVFSIFFGFFCRFCKFCKFCMFFCVF